MKLLNLKQVEYLVVGGWAVGYYGYPRATGDIDIWISRKSENALKIIEALKDFGFNVPELSQELFTKENQIIRIGVPPIRIEILTSISGVDFENCFNNKMIVKLDDIFVNFISLGDLITNKTAANRFKDLDDLNKLKN